MPRYSSEQFYQDWRYAIQKDFMKSDGEPFPYAEDGRQQWGNEMKKLSFNGEPHDGCISSDGKRLAIAVQNDIQIFNSETWDTVCVLKGHLSRISAMAFKPNDANTFVSSEQHDFGRVDPKADPEIIVWKLDSVKRARSLEAHSLVSISEAAVAVAVGKLVDLDVNVTKEDGLQDLQDTFTAALSRIATKHSVKDNVRICGRLQTSFQSHVFSPSGNWMAYMPGKAPRANNNVPWDVNICSTDDFKDQLTLKGHTDAIMWIGWDPEEWRIGTISWDGTIRIWYATTGEQTHRFETGLQNWTGSFSPDSNYFLATDGSGTVRTYSLFSEESSEKIVYKDDTRRQWRRAIAWHPNSKWVAVGGDRAASLILLDVEKQQVLQERLFSVDASQPNSEDLRSMMRGYIGTSEVAFVDQGHKLAVWSYGDSSIEVYDLTQQIKWRFARGGTEDGPEAEKWRDEHGKVTSVGGYGMLIWEDLAKGRLTLASIDFDGVRVWSLGLTKGSIQ